MSRFFEAMFAASLAIGAATVSAQVLTPGQQFAPTIQANDGNLYGIYGGSTFFSYNPANGAYKAVDLNSTDDLVLCSNAPDGTLLALNQSGSESQTLEKITMAGAETTFAKVPYSVCPVLATDGNYYGGASEGGTYGNGYLYQLTQAGAMTVIYNFTGMADGFGPGWPLLQASDGNLYGVGFYYFDASENQMFRLSATSGLTTLHATTGVSGPILEGADSNLYGVSGTNWDQITLSGAVTQVPLAPPNNDENDYYSNGNLFLGGGGQMFLEQYGGYSAAPCSDGNFLNVSQIDPPTGTASAAFGIGSDEYGGLFSEYYGITEFLAANGTFYGEYGDLSTDFNPTIGPEGECESSESNAGYTYATGSPLVQFSTSASHLLAGQRATVSWSSTSAYSDTEKLCYGYNGLSGKLPPSGSETLTFNQSGTFTPSIICGGTEVGFAQIVVGGTQLNLSSTPVATAVKGQPVTLSATIADAGTPSPTGSVQFLYNGSVIAASALNSQATANFKLATAGLPLGTYSITAKYAGDANYSATTSAPLALTIVAPSPTTTALTTSTPTLMGAQNAMFNIRVGNKYATYAPSGTVTLYVDGQPLLSTKLTAGYPSTASISTSAAGVPPDIYSVTAKYSGDTFNKSSTSPAVKVTVENGETITVSAKPNPVPDGQSFTLTTTVTGKGTPTGTVFFYANSQELSSSNLNAGGVAAVTLPAGTLASGSYSITASYAGDSNNPAGTSAAYSLTVE